MIDNTGEYPPVYAAFSPRITTSTSNIGRGTMAVVPVRLSMEKNKTMSKSNTQNDAGPKRFDLVKPFDFRGSRIDHFIAREPKVRDLRQFLKLAETDSIAAVEATLANLCSVDNPVIADMSIKDFGVMKKWFEDFLSDLIPDSEM